MRPNIVFLATYDTKGLESEYIKRKILDKGVNCITVDVGVRNISPIAADVSLEKLCDNSGHRPEDIRAMKRGEAVELVSKLADIYVSHLFQEGKADAIIGIGGAGGTQIVTQTMRTLPFGLPKLMLSTLASGNTRWYLQDSDITIIPSIADVAGLNGITEIVFSRFASIAAEAATWYRNEFPEFNRRINDKSVIRVAQTMYGTTTEGVTRARCRLESKGYETLVFHASGAGGRAMENFIRDRFIQGSLDMTLAEIGAHLVGGLHDAGPNRLEAAVEMEIPFVLVPGAVDTIVLPPMSDLPDKFRNGRILNHHNPTMTTMRTNIEECLAIGAFIVKKLKNARSPVKVLIPKGGLSSIDRPGDIFYFPEANEALFHALKSGLKGVDKVEVIDDPRHIYDENFGEDAADLLISLMNQSTFS